MSVFVSSLAPGAAHAEIIEAMPGFFIHRQYYADYDSALAACITFAESIGYDPYCFGVYPIVNAGWYCNAGGCHFAEFYYNATCPPGYSLDEEQQCLPVSDPKNNGRYCPKTPFVSNPVNVGTGSKVADEPVVRSGRIDFQLTYNSSASLSEVGVGAGWSHTYSARVSPVILKAGASVKVHRGDGRVLTFAGAGSDWVADADIFDMLEQLTDDQGVTIGWRYTTTDNTTELYGANGMLEFITDFRGNNQTLIYDGEDRLERVDANTGEFLVFGYDTANRISTLTDHAGRQWTYRYDANNNLEFVDNPDGTTKRYHYEDPNLPNALTGITDERGIRYATYGYDTQGRAILSTHAGNVERVDISYNDTDGTRTLTNSRGEVSTYSTTVQLGAALATDISGPGCSTCSGGNTGYQYDASNNRLSQTEYGITTQYGDYDAKGQYGYRIEAAGTSEERRTDYTYDARFFNKITSITEPSVNPAGSKVTSYTYDDFGNRTSETINGFAPDGQGGFVPVSRTTTWQYNGPLNQLSFIDGPRTDVNDYTTYRYYGYDALEGNNLARLKEIEDANGVLIRSNIQYSATGKLLSESRPNGLTLAYSYYPGNDRLDTLTESDGTTSRVTKWTYLATGEVETITTGFGTPDATTLTFGYDDARRLTRITDGLGNYIEYTLDTEGNRTFEKTFDATDALRRKLSQTFDIYNRLDSSSQANEYGNFDFSPDGTLDVQSDGKGSVADYSYDALRRLTRVIQDQGGSDPATADVTTRYDYDVADRLTSVTDAVGGNTTYAYDDLGNLVSQMSADTGITTFQYDAAGGLIQKKDAKGQVFTYSYDALNRLSQIDSPGTTDDIRYRYDGCANGVGRLCRVSYGNGALPEGNHLHYQYNAFGDVTRQQGLGYSYDNAGRVQGITYPSGARLDYAYDAAGRVSQVDFTVSGQTQTLADSIAYAPFGPLANLTYGNGLNLDQSFDQAYRMTGQTIAGVLERSYPAYDANGNRLSQSDTLAGNSTFSYDALNRLYRGSGPFGTRDYDYDKNGNRTLLIASGATTASSYEPNSNRLDTLGSEDVLLDANGNTLDQEVWSYSYTPHNRLATATESATLKASFAYNGLGQRLGKTDENTASGRHYLYGPSGELLVETDQDGNILIEYLYLNGQLLAIFSPDDDIDGIPNEQEAEQGTLPANSDSDGDGLPNLAEWFEHGTDANNADSDRDGVSDSIEIARHTDPNLPASVPGDGDLNQDGEVNLGDLVLLYQYVTGTRTTDPDAITHGDMNLDGELNTPDVLLLQQLLLQSWLSVEARTSGANSLRHLQWPYRLHTGSVLLGRFITPAHAVPPNSGALYYAHNDPLGTPQVMTDEAGAVVWRADYDPFGQATVDDDVDRNGTAVTLNVRFPGQYYDQETGLHYNYFRYYDPSMGRYLISDPIGLRGGPNTYAYVLNNPLAYVDPLGLIGGRNDPPNRMSRPPGNGNLWPGFDPQQPGCDSPAGRFNENRCTQQCCDEHDACYARYACNYSSWITSLFGGSGPCNFCNSRAARCIQKNRGKENCDQEPCTAN